MEREILEERQRIAEMLKKITDPMFDDCISPWHIPDFKIWERAFSEIMCLEIALKDGHDGEK